MLSQVTTLAELIDEAGRRFAVNPALGTRRNGRYEWTTYRELAALAEQVKNGLAEAGVKQGDRIALISNNSVEWAATAFGAFQLGAVIVPMYESQNAKEWRHILTDAKPAALLLSKSEFLHRLGEAGAEEKSFRKIICVEEAVGTAVDWNTFLSSPNVAHPPKPTPDSLAALIYTSGTTGQPKGVMLSHANICSNLTAAAEIFPLETSDVSLSFLPWAHSFGQTIELYYLLYCGASIGLAERVNTLMTDILDVQPTILISVPRIWNRVYEGLRKRMATEKGLKKVLLAAAVDNSRKLREGREQGNSMLVRSAMNSIYDKLVFRKIREKLGGKLRYAFSGGAALSREVALFIDGLNIPVYEGYGLTETSPLMCANFPGHRKIGSVGRPIPGVRIGLDTEVFGAEGGTGEIINYGPNTMQGYFNLPEETRAAFTPDGGLRTGDLGWIDEDGYLFITGRVKEQYKLENGKYVAPAPLEELLQLSPFIQQAMLYGDNRPYDIALIVPDFEALDEKFREEGIQFDDRRTLVEDRSVKRLLEREVAKYSKSWRHFERPRAIHIVDEEWTTENGLLTPTLKIKRRLVFDRYRTNIEEAYLQSA